MNDFLGDKIEELKKCVENNTLPKNHTQEEYLYFLTRKYIVEMFKHNFINAEQGSKFEKQAEQAFALNVMISEMNNQLMERYWQLDKLYSGGTLKCTCPECIKTLETIRNLKISQAEMEKFVRQ